MLLFLLLPLMCAGRAMAQLDAAAALSSPFPLNKHSRCSINARRRVTLMTRHHKFVAISMVINTANKAKYKTTSEKKNVKINLC